MIGLGTTERVLGVGGLVLCVVLVPFLGSGPPSGRSSPTAVAHRPAPPAASPGVFFPSPPGVPGAPAGSASTRRCPSQGSDGKRLEALYVHSFARNRFSSLERTFQRWLEQADRAFVRAARRTGGGVRHPRYVRDAQCRAVVRDVAVSDADLKDVDAVTAAIKAQGFQRVDRKYVVWYEAKGCGKEFGVGGNDRPEWFNPYNFGPDYATLGTTCWGWGPTLHEMLHALGAVQLGAPHASRNGHCWDDADVMCYDDQTLPKRGLQQVCPKGTGGDVVGNQIDCNGDDYFNTAPIPGSYLATHWNVADSEFLARE